GWSIDRKGNGVRITSAATRAFDRADRILDERIRAACGCCLRCFVMDHTLPEDGLRYLIEDVEAGHLRGMRAKLASVAKATGIVFKAAERGWWTVSLTDVHVAHTQGRSLRAAVDMLQSLLVDLEQMHRDGVCRRLSVKERAA